MIGFIKPVKIKKKWVYDELGRKSAVRYAYSDGQSEKYFALEDLAVGSEAGLQVLLAERAWDKIIAEDMRELDRQRNDLIANHAIVKAKLDRLLDEAAEAYESQSAEAIADINDGEIYELQEEEQELEQEIDKLNEKEKRCKKLIDERKSGMPAARKRRVRFSGWRVKSDVKNGEKYCYIDLNEELDGITKRVEAKTVEELREKVSVEDDRLRIAEGVIPEKGSGARAVKAAQCSIAELSAVETRHLLELFYIAVFAGALDRKAARDKIYGMLGLSEVLEKANVVERRKEGHILREAEDGSKDKWNPQTFHDYIYEYKKKSKVSISELADRIGCDRSSIYGNINGKHSPTRGRALKLAVAMELSVDDIRVFMSAAGHIFPRDEVDFELIKLISEGNSDWYELLAVLGVGEE